MELTLEKLPMAVSQLTKKLEDIENLLLLSSRSDSNPKEPQDKLLTIQEAAEFLKLTVPTIYSKVSRNELPFMKRSKRLYFSQSELLNYLKDGRVSTLNELGNEAEKYCSRKQ